MLRKLSQCLSPEGKQRSLWVLLLMVAHSLVEITGIVSILPFMMLVSKPELVQSSASLRSAQDILGFSEPRGLIIVIGLAVVFVLALGNLLAAASLGLSSRVAGLESASLSRRMFQKYLERDYIWFLGQNSAILARNVLVEAASVPQNILLPLLRLISKSITVVLIVSGLVIVNARVAIVAGVLLGGSYALLWNIVRGRLFALGVRRLRYDNLRSRLALETLSGIKTNMVMQRERTFVERFGTASVEVGKIGALQGLLYECPRFFMETFVFGGIVLGLIVVVAQHRDVETILPTLSLFTLGAYRLIPALQSIFSSLGLMRGSKSVLDFFAEELVRLECPRRAIAQDCPRMSFEREIRVEDVVFTYPAKDKAVLNGCSLTICKNTSVAFVGSTGSGKTTLVDLILGLFSPESGSVRVDDVEIRDSNARAWQKNIGYVSQDIFLMDDTIAANVAVGIPPESIDLAAVERACRLANLHDFIVSSLSEGYNTVVGDRGVRLSGGQRQRIGIARALYHDPLVLVLDEATSALDGVTESAVMEAVNQLSQKVTIIMVAHRLATVQNCNEIFMLQEGKVMASGTFSDLIATNAEFRAMARHTNVEAADG